MPDISPAQPRRAKTRLSAGKAQRAKRRGDTSRTSCGPFALAMGLGERISLAVIPISERLNSIR